MGSGAWSSDVRLNTGAFNRHISHMGQRVLWRRAYSCPCLSPDSGAAAADCPQCRGKGQIWATTGVECVVGVTQQRNTAKWQSFGNFEDGDTVLSIGADSPLYQIGRYDRVVLLNATDRFSKTYVRGIHEVLDDPVVSIERVFWLSPDRTSQIDGGTPVVGAGGVLTWGAGAPPADTQYSISGTRYVEYFAWDALTMDRNEHSGVALPRKVSVRRFDLFGR